MSKIDTVPVIELHAELNPKIWTPDGDIQPEVQVALLRIAREFYEFLAFPAPLKDVQITGSQANYTYSQYSDIDLHLIVPFDSVECDQPVEDLFDTKRKLWKERHNITIHGIPVEVYVEDRAKPAVSSNYSLLDNKWLTKPKKMQAHWDEDAVSRETLIWLEHIKDAMATGDLDKLEQVKGHLSQYRQKGLDQDGELGAQNLAFKNLRNLGAISLLMQAIVKLKDQSLSI